MVCRLCFSNSDNFLFIFGDTFEAESKIAKIIAKYIHIEIHVEDGISNKICNECWKQLEDFDNFCLSIKEKQQTLETSIPSIKCEFQPDIIPEMPLLQENIKNTSYEQQIAGLFDEQLIPEEFELRASVQEKLDFEDGYSPVSIEKSATTSTDLKGTQKSSHKSNRSTRSRENCQINKQKSNKFSERSILGAVMREHDAYIAENVELSCCICGHNLKDFLDLKKHFRVEHKCRGYILCCNNKYSKRTPYVDHLKLHNNPELFKCEKCDKVLANRNSYQNHMFSCHPSEESLIFDCTMCTKKFAKQYILDYHMATHRKEKKYPCESCEKSFCTNTALKEHKKRVHSSAMKTICHSCGKSFKCKQSFQIHHQNAHQDVSLPEVQCQICGRWLKDERSLYKHMYKHRDESSGKEYVCNVCGEVKSTKQTLRSHIRYHHPDKMHKCSLCEKEFKRLLALEEHMATHTGKSLYTCGFCPKTFKSHANMHNHKKKAHPNEWVRKYSQPSRITAEMSTN